MTKRNKRWFQWWWKPMRLGPTLMGASIGTILALVILFPLLGCASISNAEKLAAGCAAFDVATTAYGLNNGFEEANPLIDMGEGNEWQTVAMSAAVSVGMHYAIRAIVKSRDYKGKPKIAWGGYGAVRCGAGAYNLSTIKGGKND